MTALERARALLARGLSLIPIPLPQPGARKNTPGDGKTPLIQWRAYQRRRPTETELARWFATEQNIGIVTGAISDLVVVDPDSPDAVRWCLRRLTYTPWQTKSARGWHLYYRHPGVRVPNTSSHLDTGAGTLAIDVRGDGGYIIAPGSLHATGLHYDACGDWSVPHDQLPRFWPGWLARPTRTPPPPRPPLTGDIGARARAYLAAIPRPEIGHGSDAAVFDVACCLTRGFDLDPADATALIWAWCGGRDGWTLDWVQKKVAHARRAGVEPIGARR